MEGKVILVIEDDDLTCQLLEKTFGRAGAKLVTATDAREGLRRFFEMRPDLVIVDIMLPDTDGWETARQIRQLSDAPLIFLTALIDEDSIVRGLDLGAADYITKPFSTKVLLARARAALRNAASDKEPADASFQDERLHVDLQNRRVTVAGRQEKLTRTEFELLAYLVVNRGQILTFDQILSQVWGPGYQDAYEYVHVYVSRLRRKLENDPRNPTYLHSEHGIGYRFEYIS